VPGFLVDTGVWVAFAFPMHPGHKAARAAIARGDAANPIVLCRAAEQGFLRISTHATVFLHYGVPTMNNQLALALLEHVLRLPQVIERAEPPGLSTRWRQLAALPSPSPKVWMDAYLAAFAITGGYTLLTLDKDFVSYVPAGLDAQVLTAGETSV
jgi:uncharacterized protein